jgi:hypothetical protein
MGGYKLTNVIKTLTAIFVIRMKTGGCGRDSNSF